MNWRECVHLGLIYVFVIITANALRLHCPEYSLWTLRARTVCNESNYACLFDDNKQIFVEQCIIPDFLGPGFTFVIRGLIDREICDVNRFQPFIHWTNESSECAYQKSLCNGEGQVIFNNGSTATDRSCRCDYTQNYTYVMTSKTLCSCNPREEDCSCYITSCPSGHILSPEYKCVLISKWTAPFECPEIIEQQPIIREKDNEVRKIYTDYKAEVTNHSQQRKTFILMILAIILGLVLILKLLEKKSEIIQCFNRWETNRPELKKAMDRLHQAENAISSITKGKDIKNDTLINMAPFVNCYRLLIPAPSAMAILTRLFFRSTKTTDFSITTKIHEKGFKYLKNPGSFRSCLVQVCNSGLHAFNEAHRIMKQINVTSANVDTLVMEAERIVMAGSSVEIQKVFSSKLTTILKCAEESLDAAIYVEEKYLFVMHLIEELSEACIASNRTTNEAKPQIEVTNRQELSLEAKRERKQRHENMEKNVLQAQVEYIKYFEEMPGSLKMLFEEFFAAGVIDLVKSFSSLPTYTMRCVESGSNDIVQTMICKNEKRHQATYVEPLKPLAATLAEHNVLSILSEIDGNIVSIETIIGHSDNQIDINTLTHGIRIIEDSLKRIMIKVKAETESGKIGQILSDVCKQGIKICEEAKEISLTTSKTKFRDLQDKVADIRKVSMTLVAKANKKLGRNPLDERSPFLQHLPTQSVFPNAVQTIIKNLRFKTELAKENLRNARKRENDFAKQLQQKNDRLIEVLETIQNLDEDFQTIMETLQEGSRAFCEVGAQWGKFAIYFEEILNVIICCINTSLKNYEQTANVGRNVQGEEKMMLPIFLANMYDQIIHVGQLSYVVSTIADAYVEISKEHLTDKVSKLIDLMRLNPVADEQQIIFETQCLHRLCEKSQKAIMQNIREQHVRYEKDVNARILEIERKEDVLLLTNKCLTEIKEAVKTGFSTDFKEDLLVLEGRREMDKLHEAQKAMSNITERNDRKNDTMIFMAPVEICFRLLNPAPLTIAILAELFAMTTKINDFAVTSKIHENRFKYLKNPGSFHKCLVQVCNNGLHALNESYKIMNQINVTSANVETMLKEAEKIVMTGSSVEIQKVLSLNLNNIDQIAVESLESAQYIEQKYLSVMHLFEELFEACINSNVIYEENEEKTFTEIPNHQKVHEFEAKEERERRYKNMEKQVLQVQVEFIKTVEEMPGSLVMSFGISFAEGMIDAVNAFTSLPVNMIPDCESEINCLGKGISSKYHIKQQAALDGRQNSLNVRLAEHNILSIVLQIDGSIVSIEKIIGVPGDQADLNTLINCIGIITASLQRNKMNVTAETHSGQIGQRVLEICKQGVNICEEAQEITFTTSSSKVRDLQEKVADLRKESLKLVVQANKILGTNPLNDRSLFLQHVLNQIPALNAVQTKCVIENFRFKTELAKGLLRNARKRQDTFVKHLEQENDRLMTVLKSMRILGNDFQQDMKTLKEKIRMSSEVGALWGKFAVFFEEILSIIKCCKNTSFKNFEHTANEGREVQSEDQIKLAVFRANMYDQISHASRLGHVVSTMAGLYVKSFKDHLSDQVSELTELIQLNTIANKERTMSTKQGLHTKCEESQKAVMQKIKEQRLRYSEAVDARILQIEREVEAILPANKSLRMSQEAVKTGLSENCKDCVG